MPCGTKLSTDKNAKFYLSLTPDNLDYPIHVYLPHFAHACINKTDISYHSHMIQLNEKNITKINHYELKSLGWSAVKLTSAGSRGMLLLCRNRDHHISSVVFIAAVVALSGLYSFGCFSVPPLTLPSMSPFH